MAAAVTANRLMLRKLVVIAVAMFGFGFLLVPFYKSICEAIGLNSVTKRESGSVSNTQVDESRLMVIELDANARHALPWSFRSLERSVNIHPGAVTHVSYEIRNNASVPVTLQAIPSYGPAYAARYFRKLECFCFQQQVLQPGEVREMPVVFVIDPEAPADLKTVTLSYTFFEVEGTANRAAAVGSNGGGNG